MHDKYIVQIKTFYISHSVSLHVSVSYYEAESENATKINGVARKILPVTGGEKKSSFIRFGFVVSNLLHYA